MSTPDPATVVGIGVACVLTLSGGIYKVASLRSDLANKWKGRVELSTSTLNEKTLAQLETLRDRISDELPAGPFDPLSVSLDPGPLSEMAGEAAKLHREASRMELDFERLKSTGDVFTAGFALLLVPSVGFTLYYGDIATWGWLRTVSIVALVVGGLITLVTGGVHTFLHRRLALAQEHSGTTDNDG